MTSRTMTILIVALFCSSLSAQPNKLEYQEVVDLDRTVETMRKSAKAWIFEYFKDVDAVIDVEEDTHVYGKGAMPYAEKKFSMSDQSGMIRFTIKLEFKEGRYRYTFTNLTHQANGVGYSAGTLFRDNSSLFNGYEVKRRDRINEFLDQNMQALIASLVEHMKTWDADDW